MTSLLKIFLWIIYQTPLVIWAEIRSAAYCLFFGMVKYRMNDQALAIPLFGKPFSLKTVRVIVVCKDDEGNWENKKIFYEDHFFLYKINEELGLHIPLEQKDWI